MQRHRSLELRRRAHTPGQDPPLAGWKNSPAESPDLTTLPTPVIVNPLEVAVIPSTSGVYCRYQLVSAPYTKLRVSFQYLELSPREVKEFCTITIANISFLGSIQNWVP